ncbi:MAG: hypothetical protein ACTSSP_12685, partial [Candidatus Asgardarchaeia archaeon]
IVSPRIISLAVSAFEKTKLDTMPKHSSKIIAFLAVILLSSNLPITAVARAAKKDDTVYRIPTFSTLNLNIKR